MIINSWLQGNLISFLIFRSTSGIVNLYGVEDCRSSSYPNPLKIIDNLTTPISAMSFNHDAQILAIASKVKKDSFRLIHVPTKRVFSNWPTANTPLGYVNCMDFSPNGGYLATGNDKGKVLLYCINAYSKY
jgi:U3 small nucleolar RNA-associated protein 18